MNEVYIDQPLNINSIRRFLTRWEYISLFLALTCVFAVLLVVFGQPTSMINYTEQLTRLSPLGQISICFTTGLGTLTLSRAIVFFIHRAHEISPAGLVIWIIVELIVCVSVMTLVLWALSGGGKVDLAPLVGTIVLGFVGVLLIPYIITYLICRMRETRNELNRIRQLQYRQGSAAQHTSETNINFYAKGGRMAFSTKLNNILYIEAADNYVNIHYISGDKEDPFILFN